MLEGPVITSERDLLRKLASEQSPINLLDETTWGDTGYEIFTSLGQKKVVRLHMKFIK